jgi:hypothetical protein
VLNHPSGRRPARARLLGAGLGTRKGVTDDRSGVAGSNRPDRNVPFPV